MNAKRIQRELQQPFAAADLEWRVQASGMSGERPWCRVIAYVTNRAIQQRLDDVFGVFGWKNEFKPLPNSVGDGSMCGISVKFGNEWITKYDGSDNTHIEATKGGLSGSMKRAAVQFGIGRYLYDVEAEYATIITEDSFKKLQRDEKDAYEKIKIKQEQGPDKSFYWKAPELPDKFLPQKHILPASIKMLQELIEGTETNKSDLLQVYGVDCIEDLYLKEAADALKKLTLKKVRMEKEKDDAASN